MYRTFSGKERIKKEDDFFELWEVEEHLKITRKEVLVLFEFQYIKNIRIGKTYLTTKKQIDEFTKVIFVDDNLRKAIEECEQLQSKGEIK